MTIQFRPLDAAAQNGKHHLLRDQRGHQHSARWTGSSWAYGNGITVDGTIVEYAANFCGGN